MRTSAYLIYNDACGNVQDRWWRDHPATRGAGEMLRIGGVKVFLDGGSCNAPAASFPYADGSTGTVYFATEQFADVIGEIEAAGHQAAVHALGDVAVERALDAFATVLPDRSNPLRHRIDHNALVRPELRGRYDEVGVVAVLFGAIATCFLTDDDNQFRYRTPPQYVEWEWPWRDLLDLNPRTVFAWHADYPVLEPSLGRALEGFVTRNQGDCTAPPETAQHAIRVDEALRLMTVNSAYALGRETEVGSIEVGKFADLLVLSADPMSTPADQLADIAPLVTIVGGDIEYCAPGAEALCAPAAQGGPASSVPAQPTGLVPVARVSASQSLPERPPSMAIDGGEDTGWGSGADPPQWIELDLGATVEVSSIRLLVDQYPAGRIVHRLLAGDDPAPTAEVAAFDAEASYGEWLQTTGDWRFRYLRIETVVSPSWVAWLEIELRPSPP